MTVAELIAKPENWTTRVGARNKDGQFCDVNAEDAVCWCVVGAMTKLYGGNGLVSLSGPMNRVLYEAMKKLVKVVFVNNECIEFTPYASLSHWNDTHTHAEVIDAVIKAGI